MQAYKKTALIVTKFLPNTTCAGNLVYLKFIIGLTSQSVDQVTVLVLGDRFSNHEFFIADPNQHNIKYLTSFSKRIRNYHFLSSPKLLLKNLLRRSWSMLPSSARKVVYEKYMSNIFLSHSPQSKLMPMDQRLVSMVWCHIDKLRPDYVIIDKLDYIDVLAGENAKPFRSLVICHDLLSQRQISANMTHADTKMHSTGISKEIEMKKLGLADCIVCIQQHEARMIAEHVSKQVVYLPYIPTDSRVPDADERDSRNILFVGSAAMANITGLEWFLEEVWPAIKKALPDCRLNVVGDVCRHFADRDRTVRFHGKVNSMDAFYRRSSVVIVPLKFGSGLKIKLIEALSASCACVTTSIGAQGLEEGVGTAFLAADDAAKFGEAVMALLKNEALRKQFKARAVRFSEEITDRINPLRTFQEALRGPKATVNLSAKDRGHRWLAGQGQRMKLLKS